MTGGNLGSTPANQCTPGRSDFNTCSRARQKGCLDLFCRPEQLLSIAAVESKPLPSDTAETTWETAEAAEPTKAGDGCAKAAPERCAEAAPAEAAEGCTEASSQSHAAAERCPETAAHAAAERCSKTAAKATGTERPSKGRTAEGRTETAKTAEAGVDAGVTHGPIADEVLRHGGKTCHRRTEPWEMPLSPGVLARSNQYSAYQKYSEDTSKKTLDRPHGKPHCEDRRRCVVTRIGQRHC